MRITIESEIINGDFRRTGRVEVEGEDGQIEDATLLRLLAGVMGASADSENLMAVETPGTERK